jgi:hypothetical protein
MDPSAPPFVAPRRKKGKKPARNFPPSESGASSSGNVPISPQPYLPPGPSPFKRQRSSTVSSLPPIDERYLKGAPPSAYFMNLFHKINMEQKIGASLNDNKDTVVMIEMIYLIHKDYRSAVDALTETIETLTEELDAFRSATPRPATPTPIPFPLAVPETEKKSTDPDTRSANPPAAPPPPSWATVARRGGKKTHTNTARNVQVAPKPTNDPKPPQPKKGLTARERRLVIKREGAPLTMTALELRNEINHALAATFVQTVTLKGNTVSLTTMESVKATTLNSKVGAFLHLIPGTVSVHLDTPVTQLLVHGIATSCSMATIATELTTFNSGLALTTQPRWLTTETSRAGKSASTIVIAITGPKAPDFVGKRLVALSSTYRTERRLRFNSLTQCSNCHGFGHHNNRCTNTVTCQWCALTHPTGGHTCPTATCRMRGRPCNHTVLRCVNCEGPHDAHSVTCPSRPGRAVDDVDCEQLEEEGEEMMDT